MMSFLAASRSRALAAVAASTTTGSLPVAAAVSSSRMTTMWDTTTYTSIRTLSSGRNNNNTKNHNKFTPRRRANPNYRPVQPRGDKYQRKKGNKGYQYGSTKLFRAGDKIVEYGEGYVDQHYGRAETNKKKEGEDYPERVDELEGWDPSVEDPDGLERIYGIHAAEVMRQIRRQQDVYKGKEVSIEDQIRAMDYLTSAEGSTEDLVGERRALAFESDSPQEQEQFLKDVDEMIEQQQRKDLELDEDSDDDAEDGEDGAEEDGTMGELNPEETINPNQLAWGEWGELVIRVDRTNKNWRGGRIESYRALVIGGNGNGCAGFGTGKAFTAQQAVIAASRHCKRNIFFVDRYQNNSLTRDLIGKQNSCRVLLRATNRGLRGNPLSCEILKYFGIVNATCKSVHGNRSQYNVVQATFKALMTHESMEDISRKRGKRIVSLDRGRKMRL